MCYNLSSFMYKPIRKQLLLIFGIVLLIAGVSAITTFVIHENKRPDFTHRPTLLGSIVNKANSPTPSQLMNKLVITRPEYKENQLPTLTTTITDEGQIKQ